MSVIGIDLGNKFSTVGVARRGGIDILCNEVSKRKTPGIVGFNGAQRFIGEAGEIQYLRNLKNSISQIKRLLGRKWYEPEFQEEIPFLPFTLKELEDGAIGVEVMYNDELTTFSIEQILAMFFVKLKETTEQQMESVMRDVVVSVPGFFTSSQRQALLNSLTIAGLQPLRLINETTATALAYGIYKKFDEEKPVNVLFFDMGDSSTSCSVVSFTQGKLKVLAHSFDRTLGGRNFDRVITKHLAEEFKQKYKIDICSNLRALKKVELAAEKAKQVLNVNPTAPINLECLMEDKDCRAMLDRETFTELARGLLARIRQPIEEVLEASGVSPSDLRAVELVGGASRMSHVLDIVQEVTGIAPSRTLNAEECVAKGCALQCAMLSPLFQVKEFKVEDCIHYPISLSWRTLDVEELNEPTEVFKKGAAFPGIKLLTFPKSAPFELRAEYSPNADLPPGTDPFIGQWTITEVPPTTGASIKVKVRVSLHGTFGFDSAQLVETIEPEPEPESMDVEKKEETTENGKESEENKETKEEDKGKKEDEKEKAKEEKKEEKKKPQVKRTNLKIQSCEAGLSPELLQFFYSRVVRAF